MSDLRDNDPVTHAGRAADGPRQREVAARAAPAAGPAVPACSPGTVPASPVTRARSRTTALGRRLECRLARWSSWIRVDF